VVTLRVPLVVPESAADVGQQEAALKEDLDKLLKKGIFPLSHAAVESIAIASAVEPAVDEEEA